MTAAGGDPDRPVLPDFSFPDDHIQKQMAVHVEPSDAGVLGRLAVRSSMWGAGSKRPRLSLFATAIDYLAGFLPAPVRVPTIDLRAQFLSEPPSEGPTEITGQTLRVGSRLIVSEFRFRDAAGNGFGRGITTMSNKAYDGWVPDDDVEPANPIPSFEALLETRVVDERTLELDPSPQILNGLIQTPHGGAQTLFCELAAEHAAGQPCAAVDVDVHFLRPGESGPLRATATEAGPMGGLDVFRVDLTDVGAEGTLVAAATVVSRSVQPG